MAHASPVPRSYETDDGTTLPCTTPTNQAATRSAYIASILADWPPLTPQQQNTVGSLLGNGTPTISVAEYQNWEIRRQLDAEAPAKFGTYGDEVAA